MFPCQTLLLLDLVVFYQHSASCTQEGNLPKMLLFLVCSALGIQTRFPGRFASERMSFRIEMGGSTLSAGCENTISKAAAVVSTYPSILNMASPEMNCLSKTWSSVKPPSGPFDAVVVVIAPLVGSQRSCLSIDRVGSSSALVMAISSIVFYNSSEY